MSKLDDLNKKYGISSGSEQKEEKKTKVSDKFTAFQSKYGLDTSPSSFDPYASAVDDLYNQVYNTNLLRSDEDRRQLSAREKYAQREDSLSRPSGTGLTLPQTKTVAPDYSKIGELEDSLIEQKKYDKDYKAANKKLEMPQPKWATAGTRDERDARVRQRYRDEQRIRELRDILAKGTPTTPIRTPSVGELEDSLIENKKYGAPVAKDAPTNNYLVGRELTELENKIKQEDARIDERRAAEKLHEYFALTKNDDFEQNSKYDDSDRGFTLYNAVNGDSEARAAIGNEQAELAGGGDAGIGNLITGRYDEKATAQLLPSQKKIFNYLYKTRGAEAAQEYYDLLKSELYQRVREADSQYWQQYAEDKPVEASVFSVLTKPASTLSYAGQLADFISTGKLDRNSPTNRFVDNNNDIRQTVSKNFGKAGNFFYQTGMSMADFIYTGLISGSFFMGAGAGVASKVAEAITLGIMGTEAAADTVVQKMDAGYDDKRAFILGTIAGAAEILTERVSLEALLNTDVLKHGAKGFAQYLLKNAAAEGSEEGFSDLINWFADDLYDVITSQDESEWKRKLRELKEQYPDASDSALLGKAIGQRAAELGLDVAGGALSGALMAGGSSALNLFNASGVGKEIKSMGDDVVHQAVDVGLKNDKNSESYKIATELDAKLKDGKMLTDLEVGQLYQANYAEIEKAEADGKLRLPIVQQKFMNDLQNNINQRILESQNTTQNEQANTEAQTALETQEAAQTAQQLTSEANLNAQENAAEANAEAVKVTPRRLQLPTVKESNNGREVYLRDSSQRADSTNPGEQVRAVEESAGRDSLRQTAAVAKDSGAVNVSNNGEAKSARELTGLDNFDDSDRSFYEATGNLSRDMQSAKRALAALGLNLRIWLGGNMKRLDGASIEGVISGKDVWVRGDHPLFTSSQLAGHEKGHYLIDSGAISSKEMRAIVEQLTSEDFVRSMINEYGQRWNKGRLPLTKQQRAEAIAGLYASAFEGSDLTAEQIWDEIICDSIGNMNRFEGVRALAELKGKADTLLQYTGKEAGKQASRAPPSESRNESGNARYSKDLNERSRALRPGEMVNEYRDKVNWPEYYQKILNAEYNADNFEDGEFATMTLGNSVLTLQMQRNGEWAVVGMEDINERMGNNRKPSENGNQGDRELPAERSRNSGGSDLAQSEQRARNTKKDSNVQNAEGISKDASAVLQRRGSVKRFSREFTPTASDEKYLAAVNSGDMETAQKMVDEAAKAAGYRTERFHGTRANFTQFNPDYAVHGGSGYGYYFGDKELADEFGKGGKVLRVLINDKNIGTLKTHNITAAGFEAALKRLGLSADKTYKYMGADSASKYVKRNHDYRLATDLQYWAVNPRKYAENPNVKQRSPREIITILRDSLGLDGIERGREIVLWDNTLMKLADPVTYDDSGNVIPLSERFNEKNEDIRYSREFDADLFDVEEDNRKRIAELQKELAKARKGELYWKGQTKRTTTKTLREADVNKLAKRLIKNYESTLEAEDIAPKLKALGEYLLNNGDGKNELTYTEFSDRAADIARDIVDSAMAEAEGNDTATLKDIRKYLRSNTLKLPAQNKADMIDYAAFKKANPALKVSTQSGLDVDVAYQEMQEMFGKAFFPDDIINPADQLQRIADVVHSLEPVYENPYNYYKADAIDYISADIVDSLLGESVRQNPPTVMDKAMKAAEEKRARQVQKAIEHGKQRVAEVRAQKNEQLQALKEYYTEQKQNERERRADSQARTKLLKIARRLNNKKLPLVMKNQLAQYIGELDLVAKSMTGKTLDKLTELKKWYENQKAELGEDFTKDDAIEEKLDRLSKKHINDLSAQEVADLTQILQFFEASIIEANKFKNSEVKQDRYAAGMRTVFDVQNARKGKINWQLRPSSAAMRIVGYDETSPIVTLMEEMIEGERQYDLYQREAVKPFEKWINDKKFMESFSGKDARKLTIKGTDVNGSEATQEITPAMLAEMLLASRNDDNMRHYQAGYAVFPDMKEYRKGNIEEAYNNTNKLSIKRSDILAAAKSLTKAELEYAAEIAKYYNDFAPKRLNETSLVIDGYEKFLEENYYPIVSDNKFLNQDYESLDENGNNAGLARPGFGEKRTHASNPAIVRDANLTLMQQIRMNGRYATMAIPLQNMSRLLNVKGRGMTTSVRETLAKQYSSSADAYLKKFMQDYAGKSAVKERGLDPVLKKVRSKYAGGVLALSAGTAIKQAASYPTAAAITGAKPLLQAMNATLKADTSFIDELTAVYTKRKQGFSSVELGDLASINKSLPKALNWIQAVDVGTTKLLKRAAYFAVKSESPNLKVGSDAFKKAVVSKYIEIIEKTQPNYSVALRPEVLRSNSEIVRTISMFMTQPLQNYNLLYDAFGNYNAKRTAWKNTHTAEAKAAYQAAQKQLARTVTSQFVSALVFALMQFGWDRLRGKDKKYKEDGKLTLGSFAKGTGLNMLTSGAGMFVGGKTALELAESIADGIIKNAGGDTFFDQSFYGLESAELGAITDAGKAAANLINLVGDIVKKSATGEDIDWEASVRKLLTGAGSIGVMFGVPVDNVTKDVQAFARSILHTMGHISGDPVKGDFLAKRIVDSGASEYYDQLYNYYKTDRDMFAEYYNLMLKYKVSTADKIKDAMEDKMKKDQGVDNVKDLDKRFLSPEEDITYDAIMTSAEKSPLWKGSRAAVQQKIKTFAYDAAEGKETKADDMGISYEQYVTILLNLDKYDTPNKSGEYGGDPTNDEVTAALNHTTGYTRQELYNLWQELTGSDSDKNNPYRAQGSTVKKVKTEAKEQEKAEEKERGVTEIDTSYSSMFSGASYDPSTHTLKLKFRGSGKTYTYNVPESVWEDMKNADSLGNFYNSRIKGKYSAA